MAKSFRRPCLGNSTTRIARRRHDPAARAAFGRSLCDFLPLLTGEQRLLLACRLGEVAALGNEMPHANSDERQIRAAFLRFLLLGGDEQAPVHEHGVMLQGAFVEGNLDLNSCQIPHNVVLLQCRFNGFLFAEDARVTGFISLDGSLFPQGIRANRLRCNSYFLLGNGFEATGPVRLAGAQIAGNLVCHGGKFKVNDGDALFADGLVVKGDVFFTGGFKATGRVRLVRAQIEGNLECKRGQFEVDSGEALWADRLVVSGSVVFTDGFKATGQVRLVRAQIEGNFQCKGGQFWVKSEDALAADGLVVKGSAFFSEGFKATGGVRLLYAQIEGNLECRGGQFDVEEGDAFMAAYVVVKGTVFLDQGFKATGKVSLLGAQVAGNLQCDNGQFVVKEGVALSTEKAVVGGAWHFAILARPLVVNAGHMQVAVLVDAFESWGEGSVLDGLRFGALGGNSSTQAYDRLAWLHRQSAAHLGDTSGGVDFRPQPWRHLQRVLKEMGHADDARQIGIAFEMRSRKIGRIGRSPPGTWALAASCKRAIARAGHTLFGWFSGYGYRPMRLMGWIALVWLISGVGYWFLALPPYGAIGPSDPLVFQNGRYATCVPGSEAAMKPAASGAEHAGNWYLCEPLPAEYSTFSPFAYSLDIILPLVDLGQEKSWGPVITTPHPHVWEELLTLSPGHVVRWLVWFETLFGWIASLLLVGIVSGFAKRTEE